MENVDRIAVCDPAVFSYDNPMRAFLPSEGEAIEVPTISNNVQIIERLVAIHDVTDISL